MTGCNEDALSKFQMTGNELALIGCRSSQGCMTWTGRASPEEALSVILSTATAGVMIVVNVERRAHPVPT
jgi:hypothetical protein